MEMVAPIGLGALLDYYLGWSPWLTIAGALLGFVGGMMHLLALLNQPKDNGPPRPGQEAR
jgi:F0F1-type ATP synthase assembly protein I